MSEFGTITCDGPAAERSLGPLPVKVRTPDGEIIGVGVSGSPIGVPPGLYFVSVVTPDGRERSCGETVTVTAGADTISRTPAGRAPAPPRALAPAPVGAAAPEPASASALAPASASAPARIPHGQQLIREAVRIAAKQIYNRMTRGFVAAESVMADAPTPPPPAAPAPTTETVRLWQGNWFAAWDAVPGSRHPALEAGLGETFILSQDQPTQIARIADCDQLVAQPIGACVRYSVVPFDECTACVDDTPGTKDIAANLASGPAGSFVRFRSTVTEEANTLLSFVENGVLTEMWTVSEDMVNQGERAMLSPGGSVLRAVTGAYVLLRANELSGLDAWLTSLGRLSPALPDIPILRAELLARLGQHEDALALLQTAIGGRCPWFRSGLSYMLERVRLYIDVSANSEVDFAIARADLPQFIAARERLDTLMRMLVRSRTLTTFDVPAE
ncbi:hypothetical protein GCM10011529_10180 [Polymorphobacter glacialis]|uniref:Uncharacterized protein n=1 Tax=Sandarakinorhabdus glacialis TaxID=1614636 RepID=A0A917E748_9SPHN|nr:hypothetical protein GCM10011529_10180 [Polymorphobacter glacialis]